MALFN
jgi:hypothetical protein